MAGTVWICSSKAIWSEAFASRNDSDGVWLIFHAPYIHPQEATPLSRRRFRFWMRFLCLPPQQVSCGLLNIEVPLCYPGVDLQKMRPGGFRKCACSRPLVAILAGDCTTWLHGAIVGRCKPSQAPYLPGLWCDFGPFLVETNTSSIRSTTQLRQGYGP